LELTAQQLSLFIKEQSSVLGFTACGIAPVRELTESKSGFESWLSNGYQGEMSYLERNKEKRYDPSLLVEGAKSVISFAFNYFPKEQQSKETYQIAKYAYGKDYHIVLKDKLHKLLKALQEIDSSINGRAFADSAPVLERAWAVESGLGWIGKHSLLILSKAGSYFFLCELIVNVALEYDTPFLVNSCGNCTKCIDACPTKAIESKGLVNATKCISYLTIEKKGEIPKGTLDTSSFIFGCDVCQDVCPWNKFAKPHNEADFMINPTLQSMNKKEFEELTIEEFKKLAKDSPLERAGYEKIKNSISVSKGLEK
jgi:epoxyqueuosine reductase